MYQSLMDTYCVFGTLIYFLWLYIDLHVHAAHHGRIQTDACNYTIQVRMAYLLKITNGRLNCKCILHVLQLQFMTNKKVEKLALVVD